MAAPCVCGYINDNGQVCLGGGTGTGSTVSFVVGDADLGANGSRTFTFGKNSPFTVMNDAAGSGQGATPSYSCPAGKSITEVLSTTTDVGTKWQYSITARIPFACPTESGQPR